MKKVLSLIPIVALLAACGTTDPYGEMQRNISKEQQKDREKVVSSMPTWMSELPRSEAARFAAAEGSAKSINDAIGSARDSALADLCMTDGGVVDSQSKQSSSNNTEFSSRVAVTRTRCKAIELTGYEPYSPKGIGKNPVVIPTSTGYTAFILLALPTGKANVMKQAKEQAKREERDRAQAQSDFKELDKP